MRKYVFPGASACLHWMRGQDESARVSAFYMLLPRAAAHVDLLLEEFRRESDAQVRRWLLELLAEARSPRTRELLAELLNSPDEYLSSGAARALELLDTAAAHRTLAAVGAGN